MSHGKTESKKKNRCVKKGKKGITLKARKVKG
jgi:hypothetical protein